MHRLLKYSVFTLLCCFMACNNERDPFEISKQHVGLLTDSTQVKDLKLVFPNDSIVKRIGGDEFTGNKNNIEILDKIGKQLLLLEPSEALDSTSVFETVQIIDERYKTDKNITVLSTFKDITDNYKISRIDNLINSIVVTVKSINASFTIDKKELPSNLRIDMDLQIEATHIPDNAKIKYFFINWH
ncbi:hypothetical protein EYD45_16130 [Hyunsoonleella flava]|uniref:Uncharacterized protein n=1 Tax=Hyunsoonleella flava TaxID=2527939 RepID=A0A4Q9FCH5_9FLAO|nr:hypothetical protein [Hyunsoonleella flava]TBM98857.1 hypothetical protein EYD45_16130 [Hyunsoonleella flava]